MQAACNFATFPFAQLEKAGEEVLWVLYRGKTPFARLLYSCGLVLWVLYRGKTPLVRLLYSCGLYLLILLLVRWNMMSCACHSEWIVKQNSRTDEPDFAN
jgi:hypothetical protein